MIARKVVVDTSRYLDFRDGVSRSDDRLQGSEGIFPPALSAQQKKQGTPIPTNDLYSRDGHFDRLPQIPRAT